MISFRYHIVSIVSVFLALAVGVALGGGPLKGEVDNSLVEQVRSDRDIKADLRAEVAALRSTDEFTDTFARTSAPGMIDGALQGRVVTMVVLPGASDGEVTSIGGFVSEAGGTVGGTLRVGEDLIDVSNKQLVEELGSQLLDGTPDVSVPDDASGYERMGALVARAVGTPEEAGAAVDEASNSILSGLSTAGLMSADGELARRGSLVLLVAGPRESSSDEQQGANSIVISLAEAIDARTEGVVVAGPVATARTDGLVNAVRADEEAARELSTVDALPRTAAELVTVMALGGQARGESGHYGALDAPDGAMPGAVPAPR